MSSEGEDVQREIIRIDESKCDGCGQCVAACPEGAIRIIDGKARLVKESYCDGLGACVGECPRGALTVERREADAFDEQAVRAHLARREVEEISSSAPPAGCPGVAVRQVGASRPAAGVGRGGEMISALTTWPVQLALVSTDAPFLRSADLLVSADCVPVAVADFHDRLLAGRVVVVACPKLDGRLEQYAAKLESVFRNNDIRSVTVAHMEVPCCGGIVRAVRTALERSGRTDVEFRQVTVGISGELKRQGPSP